jgi:hypothetical protein
MNHQSSLIWVGELPMRGHRFAFRDIRQAFGAHRASQLLGACVSRGSQLPAANVARVILWGGARVLPSRVTPVRPQPEMPVPPGIRQRAADATRGIWRAANVGPGIQPVEVFAEQDTPPPGVVTQGMDPIPKDLLKTAPPFKWLIPRTARHENEEASGYRIFLT